MCTTPLSFILALISCCELEIQVQGVLILNLIVIKGSRLKKVGSQSMDQAGGVLQSIILINNNLNDRGDTR